MTRSQIDAREDAVPYKVMRRMDRRFRKHRVRSYYGYQINGPIGAKLLFDDQTIEIGMFGTLRRIQRSAT
jgi:hypothetical protein